MTASDVDIIRSLYDTIERGDLEGGLALLAADCSWKEMDGFPYRGTFRGPDEVRAQVFERLGADWDGYLMTVDRILDAGDGTVVGVGTYSGTYRATGKAMSARVVHVFTVRDGKVASFEQFTDTLRVAEAMEA